MGASPKHDQILQAVMSGAPAAEIIEEMKRLIAIDRQAVLCTICWLQSEIAKNSIQHGSEVAAVLTALCSRYINGVATCGRLDPVAIHSLH